MKVRSITPIHVPDAELARRQARYDELAPAGVAVTLVNLPGGEEVPRRLESTADIAASDRLVAAEIRRTDPAAHDVVLPDCVLDPGVASVGDAPVPVVGILQLSAGFLATLGHRFGAMARNRVIADELRACVSRYGVLDHFDEVALLDLSFDDIHDTPTWNAAIDRVRARFAGHDVAAVVNGCSAVEVRAGAEGVAVVDPTKLALDLLGAAAGSGLPADPRPVVPR